MDQFLQIANVDILRPFAVSIITYMLSEASSTQQVISSVAPDAATPGISSSSRSDLNSSSAYMDSNDFLESQEAHLHAEDMVHQVLRDPNLLENMLEGFFVYRFPCISSCIVK